MICRSSSSVSIKPFNKTFLHSFKICFEVSVLSPLYNLNTTINQWFVNINYYLDVAVKSQSLEYW